MENAECIRWGAFQMRGNAQLSSSRLFLHIVKAMTSQKCRQLSFPVLPLDVRITSLAQL